MNKTSRSLATDRLRIKQNLSSIQYLKSKRRLPHEPQKKAQRTIQQDLPVITLSIKVNWVKKSWILVEKIM